MRRLACVGRGAAFRGLPRKQVPEGPQPGRRFESRSQAPRGAWSTGAWAVAVPVLPGCPATGPLKDRPGPRGNMPLRWHPSGGCWGDERCGATTKQDGRWCRNEASACPRPSVPGCGNTNRRAGARRAPTIGLPDWRSSSARHPFVSHKRRGGPQGPTGNEKETRGGHRPREGETMSCAHSPCHCRVQPDNPCHDGAEALPADFTHDENQIRWQFSRSVMAWIVGSRPTMTGESRGSRSSRQRHRSRPGVRAGASY
jgi:hypothetical protein